MGDGGQWINHAPLPLDELLGDRVASYGLFVGVLDMGGRVRSS